MKKLIKSALIVGSCFVSLTGCSKKKPVHSFSVSDDKQVYFAESNLQYNAKQNKWRFAPNAYDYIGLENMLIDQEYDGYIDLFSWGSTGYNEQYPWDYSIESISCGEGHKDIAGTNYDFGINTKSQIGDGYRMFTHDEIHYLLMFRDNAENLFGFGSIAKTKGLFILPDDFATPEGIDFVPATKDGFTNRYDWYWSIGDNQNYTKNLYDVDQWKVLKDAGAVFLPTGGMRYEQEVSHVGVSGHYWTSSHYGAEFANCLCLFEQDLFLEGNFDRNYGLSVRLVKDAQ